MFVWIADVESVTDELRDKLKKRGPDVKHQNRPHHEIGP